MVSEETGLASHELHAAGKTAVEVTCEDNAPTDAQQVN